MTVGIIVLAAGGSERLGRPKQLLPFQNGTLLSHAASQAADSKADEVVVVIGPFEDECRIQTNPSKVCTIFNADWQSGMSTSIRAGVRELAADERIDAVLITTCDQPQVKSDHLDTLIDCFLTAEGQLVATAYKNSFGIPALFGRKYFEALCNLQGESGAKSILHENQERLIQVSLEGAEYDIDTEADYYHLLHSKNT